MDELIMHEIKPVANSIRIAAGGVIHYSIDKISDPGHVYQLGYMGVKSEIYSALRQLLREGVDSGDFMAWFCVPDPDTEADIAVSIQGQFHIGPDMKLLRRIFRWHYNYSQDEALTREDFIKAYGQAFGDHFYVQWEHMHRDIMRMVGYFCNNEENGQKFLGMVMRKVIMYEKRQSDTDKQIIGELFERTAPSVCGDTDAK